VQKIFILYFLLLFLVFCGYLFRIAKLKKGKGIYRKNEQME